MSDRTVVLELAGEHQLARDLIASGVFVPGYELPLNEDCELVLVGASEELRLVARVVWAGNGGVGLQLVNCDSDMKERIATLAAATQPAAPPIKYEFFFDEDEAATPPADGEASGEPAGASAGATDAPTDATPTDATPTDATPTDASASASAGASADTGTPAVDEPAEQVSDTEAAAALAAAADAGGDGVADDSEGDDDRKRLAANVNERLRGLTLVQQVKLAHTGELSERIVLERMYGKNVWEALLRNPRLTGPEVARIARMGALPRPMIEIIVGNGGWLQIPEVRRALLQNHRLGTDHVLRVLRLLPKHELKLTSTQSIYPMAVRDAAKRLLKELGA